MTIKIEDLAGVAVLFGGVVPFCGWLVHVALMGGV